MLKNEDRKKKKHTQILVLGPIVLGVEGIPNSAERFLGSIKNLGNWKFNMPHKIIIEELILIQHRDLKLPLKILYFENEFLTPTWVQRLLHHFGPIPLFSYLKLHVWITDAV
ncbi:hypothetical protein V6Z11_D06G255500 [Gossypium hirsutum]